MPRSNRDPKGRYPIPRWVRKGRAVIVTHGERAGHLGTIMAVFNPNKASVMMAGDDVAGECPIAWLKRLSTEGVREYD